MKNILFPTDFSQNANNALDFALKLAVKTSSKIILFNAYQVPYNRADMMVSVLDILKEDSLNGLNETVKNIKANPAFAAIEIETLSRVGDVVNTTTDVIAEKDIDLIVMGTKGESGMLEKIIGSNTASVIKNVNCPVLAVPEKATFSAPFTIGFAYDMKEVENPSDLRFLAEIAKAFNAQIQFYCVVPEAKQQDVKKVEENLKPLDFFSGIKTEAFFGANGDIVEGLQEMVKEKKPDWMVMVAKKYTLFESLFHTSITKSMVIQTEKPMMILHNFNS
jgi:nucleotide-binding universal stress UspA family protein